MLRTGNPSRRYALALILVAACGRPTQQSSLRSGHGGAKTSAQTALDGLVHDLSFSLDEDRVLTNQPLFGDATAAAAVRAAGATITISEPPTLGDATVSASGGTFDYRPHANANGADHFQFRVDTPDGAADTATATLDIAPVNDAPVAVADVVSCNDGESVLVEALANDLDVDGKDTEQLIIDQVTVPPDAGTAELTGSKTSFVYKPPLGSEGKVLLHYRIVDQAGASAIGTVEATITRVNAGIKAANDQITTTKNVVAHANVLANDSVLTGATITAITAVSPPLHGQVTIALDGATTYTPDNNYTGLDGFSYIAETSRGDKGSAVVSITITAP